MKIEKINLDNNKNVSLDTYLLDSSAELGNITKRPAVLIFPGGGYFNTSEREAEPIAMAYLAEGYNAFILRYSVGKESSFSEALNDAEEAISMIREKAELWNTDENKIATIGFSAGGHLAAALGTIGKQRPNALILGYPCILSDINLAFAIPSLEKEIDDFTPATFIFSSFEDEVVPIEHSLSFINALNKKNIPFEAHIFQKGAHGLSLSKPLSSSGLKDFVDIDFSQWFELSVSWLKKQFDDFPAEWENAVPKAEDVKQYSISIQIGSLLDHQDCREVLLEYLPLFADAVASKGVREYSVEIVNQFLPQPLSETQLLVLDKHLRAIPYKE